MAAEFTTDAKIRPFTERGEASTALARPIRALTHSLGTRMLEKLFKLREHGTTVKTELIAGLTTFLTMSYIIFVNPDILSSTGMDRSAVFVATCLPRRWVRW